jgi:hypothetical protein
MERILAGVLLATLLVSPALAQQSLSFISDEFQGDSLA